EIIVDDNSTTFYVTDVRIDGRKLKYDCYVYISFPLEPDFNAGDVVLLNGVIMSNPHNKFDTVYGSNRAAGRGYFASVSTVSKRSYGDAPFPLNLQLAIKRALFSNTDEYTASICQALILGDKRGIDSGLYDNISASGLAHVLAVSGLHISLLAGVVYFLLKKTKLNPKIAFIVVTVLTFLYSMLCSFTASSLRAFIMCGVLMFSSAFSKKRDNLSALSLAAVLILIFRPTALLEVGFLLSFYSVLGIFLFYKPFRRVGMRAVHKLSPKRHIGKRFVDVCAVSLATNIMTLPLVAMFFGKLPTLFILSNFIVLPYVMAIYVLLLVCTLLTLITTFGGFVWIMKFLLIPFRLYVGVIGGLPFSTVPASASAAMVVCFTVIALFVSRFVFLGRRSKAIGAASRTSASVNICLLGA
ncbi:MAG: ComEC/Rec2 family competence protein, partial [Clostridia bacterium]|nr:ComEC/Rec2 family competence protein [Clostridia bacterium]